MVFAAFRKKNKRPEQPPVTRRRARSKDNFRHSPVPELEGEDEDYGSENEDWAIHRIATAPTMASTPPRRSLDPSYDNNNKAHNVSMTSTASSSGGGAWRKRQQERQSQTGKRWSPPKQSQYSNKRLDVNGKPPSPIDPTVVQDDDEEDEEDDYEQEQQVWSHHVKPISDDDRHPMMAPSGRSRSPIVVSDQAPNWAVRTDELRKSGRPHKTRRSRSNPLVQSQKSSGALSVVSPSPRARRRRPGRNGRRRALSDDEDDNRLLHSPSSDDHAEDTKGKGRRRRSHSSPQSPQSVESPVALLRPPSATGPLALLRRRSRDAAGAPGPQDLQHQEEAPPPEGAMEWMQSLSFHSDGTDDQSIEVMTQETKQQLADQPSLSETMFPANMAVPSPIAPTSARRRRSEQAPSTPPKHAQPIRASQSKDIEPELEDLPPTTGLTPRRTTSLGSVNNTPPPSRKASPSPFLLQLEQQEDEDDRTKDDDIPVDKNRGANKTIRSRPSREEMSGYENEDDDNDEDEEEEEDVRLQDIRDKHHTLSPTPPPPLRPRSTQRPHSPYQVETVASTSTTQSPLEPTRRSSSRSRRSMSASRRRSSRSKSRSRSARRSRPVREEEDSKDGTRTYDSQTTDGTSLRQEFRQAMDETVQKVVETFRCHPDLTPQQILSNPTNVMNLFYDTLLCVPAKDPAAERQRPYYNEAFTKEWLRQMTNVGMSILYLQPPRSPGNELSDEWKGRSVQLSIVPGGTSSSDPDAIQPKLQWSTMAGGKSSLVVTTSICLLHIHSILTTTSSTEGGSFSGIDMQDEEDDEYRESASNTQNNCFLTITSERGQVHMFEAESEEARDRLLNGLRNVITRLSFHLIAGDARASVELYHENPTGDGELPRLPNPRLNMNRIAHALLDS